MQLPRRFARLSLVLTVTGILAIPAGIFLRSYLSPLLGIGIFFMLYILGGSIQMRYLRCPRCGKSVLPAKWSNKTPVFCPKCKSQFLWDDI